MAPKPGGKLLAIREQIIEDPVSGLTIQFCLVQGSSGPARMRIFGDIPFGNREIVFDVAGEEAGAGTALTNSCRPSWLNEIES